VEVKKEGFKTFGEVVTVKTDDSEEVTIRLEPLVTDRPGPKQEGPIGPGVRGVEAKTAAVSKAMTNRLAKLGTLVVLGQGIASGNERPLSLGYARDGKAENSALLFSRRSSLVGDLHALAYARDGGSYYLCRNRFVIVREGNDGEEAFFTHHTYVRDLTLDDQGDVYFSEASGAGGDGKVYRVVPAADAVPATAVQVCTVRRQDVGYWAGDFAFGRTAAGGLDTDTLYLSSGNQIPASIYRMTREDGVWGMPERLFGAEMSIGGLVLTGPREAYFVSGNQVFRLADFQKAQVVWTLPNVSRLSDLTIMPPGSGDKTEADKR
jgi:hypothetical protein